MVQQVKPRGGTAKTAACKALLTDLRYAIQPATNEQFAAELREKKHRKQMAKHWSKKQIENDNTLLNFMKKYRV